MYGGRLICRHLKSKGSGELCYAEIGYSCALISIGLSAGSSAVKCTDSTCDGLMKGVVQFYTQTQPKCIWSARQPQRHCYECGVLTSGETYGT